MFIANKNGAYRLFDNTMDVVSDAISEDPTVLTGTAIKSWKTTASNSYAANFGRIVVHYEADRRMVLFAGSTAASNLTEAWAYYLPTKEWYYLSLGSKTIAVDSGLVSGKDGEIYLSNATELIRLFAGATYENCSWVSKEFHLSEPSQEKDLNKIK